MDFAEAPRRLKQLARVLYKDGPLGLTVERARLRWKQATNPGIAVFEWRPGEAPEMPDAADADGRLWIGRYTRPEEVPLEFYRAAEAEEGIAATSRFLDEFLDAGVLWVPWLAGRAAGYQWTRQGGRLCLAHRELEPEETHVFSAVTFRQFRRRGIAARTMIEVCQREVVPSSRAVAEAFVGNAAAVRMFEAAGFRRSATSPSDGPGWNE